MPYLNIQTNQLLTPESKDKLLSESSKLVAEGLSMWGWKGDMLG